MSELAKVVKWINATESRCEVKHGLNTKFVLVQVYRTRTGEKCDCGISTVDEDTILLEFSVPIAAEEYRVVIIG